MVEVVNLTYGYDKKNAVLNNVSFTIKPGITALVGENGCGKSTLLKLLTGSIPCGFTFLIDGKEVSDKEKKTLLSYLPQEFEIFPSLKVKEVLHFIAVAKGVNKERIDEIISKAVELTNVQEYVDKKMKYCSPGIKRRVGIAGALLGDAKCILLDEPTAGIDPKERIHFYNTIKKVFNNKMVILATHILDDLDMVADNVMMLASGKIIFDDSIDAFKHSLDGKVATIDTEQYMAWEKEKQAQYPILSSSNAEIGKKRYHILCTIDNAEKDGLELVGPTYEDIWCYFQWRNEDGKMADSH